MTGTTLDSTKDYEDLLHEVVAATRASRGTHQRALHNCLDVITKETHGR